MGSTGEKENTEEKGGDFSIEEAAGILGCSTRTVQRMIANGWLQGLAGKPNKAGSGRVSKKSLYQLLVYDRLSNCPRKVLRNFKYHRHYFERNSRQNALAKHFSMDEGGANAAEAPADPSPYPLPQGERENDSEQRKKSLHYDFAERHQFSFGWRARQLAPGDPALQDDLVQEMSLAVLEYDKPANFEYLFELAGNRAKMFLRYEARRGMLSLSQVRQASDAAAEKIASLNAFIDELMKRGVPVEWIEEVLGERLDVA